MCVRKCNIFLFDNSRVLSQISSQLLKASLCNACFKRVLQQEICFLLLYKGCVPSGARNHLSLFNI